MPFRIVVATAAVALALPAAAQNFERGARNTDKQPAYDWQFRAPLQDSDIALQTETIVDGLVHPWGIAVMRDGGFLVTERPGRLRHVTADGTLSAPVVGVPEVVAQRQGGLLDVALGPDFAETRRVYLTYAKPVGAGLSATAAGYGRLSPDMTALEGFTDIFVQEPGSNVPMHFGSRIVFDGSGHAVVTTGEHFTRTYRAYAQDLDKTFGKVIRVTPDGAVPQDNPYVGQTDAIDTIWSHGHRNIQGAMMRDGELWTVEHGPAGGDELNRPAPGANYGWPVVSYGENYNGTPVGSGDAHAEGMAEPVYFWDPVIAPGDMTTYDGDSFPDWQGDVFIASLVPGGVVRLEMQGARVATEERLVMQLGRVRDVTTGPDGALLAITDKPDGALLRIRPRRD